MNISKSNRGKIFSTLKRIRGDNSSTLPTVLNTPVGSFSGQDVLEGFAADTEHLGKTNDGETWFDQGFYKLCKLDNIYIFELSAENPPDIPPM